MKRVLLSIFLTMAWLFSVGQGTITTSPPLINNNGQNAITFNVSSTVPTEITGINSLMNNGVTTADVWIRIGGVTPGGNPNVSAAGGWTQVVTGGAVTGANGTALAPITIATPIQIPANTIVGVCVSGGLSYQSGTSADQVTYTDGTFTVSVADSVGYGGTLPSSLVNNPRRFLGSVTYALAVTGNCTPFTGFQIDSISATAAKVNWTPGTGNTGYRLEYGTAGFTPGTGTVVSGTYPTSPVTPPVVLSGLSANTNYDVYFEEYCAGPDTVGFPTPQTFQTTKLCAAPTAFTDSNLTSNTVDLGWAQAGSYNSALILYGPAGTLPGSTGWLTSTVQSPFTTTTLTGLSPSTAYDIYIATNCGGGNGVSDTVGPISINTPIQGPQGITCTTGSPGILFADDFETQGGWTGDFGSGNTASNWNYNSGGTGSGGTGPNGAHSGSFYIYTETSGTGAGVNIEAISPRIDLSSSFNSAELSFWIHAFGGGIDTVRVQVGSTTTGPWNTVFTSVDQIQTANGDPWQNVGVNLDNYVGSAIYLRFLVIHGGGFQGDVAIDNIEINSCQTCPFPGSPQVTFVSSDSAYVTWTGSGTAYNINWGPRGFTQGSPSTNFDSTTVNSIGLGGLTGNTAYDIYIQNDCSDSANGTSGWIGPVSFVTLCNPLTAPYFNDFDSDSIDSPPICWDNAIIGGTSTTAPNADVELIPTFYTPQSAPNVVRFYNFNVDTLMLFTPQFSDMSVGDKRINFYAMTTTTLTTGNDLEVGTIASIGDRNSYTPLDTFSLTNTMQQFFMELTTAAGYNGTHEFIAFRHIGNNFRTFYIDDFTYEQIPACNPPLASTLGVSGVGVNVAVGVWGSGSAGDATVIEWGLNGFTPGAGSGIGRDTVGGNVDMYTMTGLVAQTTYDFYIRDSCAASGLSPWVGPYTFTTACNVFSAPFLENFDGASWVASGSNANNALDPCWSSDPDVNFGSEPFKWIPRSTGPSSGNGPLNDLTGVNYMYVEASGSTSGDSAFLYSPIIDVSSLTAPALYFWQHRSNFNNTIADLRVDVTNDNGASWTTVYNISGALNSASSAPWEDEFVNLPQFVGDTIQVRFVQLGLGCCGDAAIDSVAIAEAPSCPDPSTLVASSITDTSASFSWLSANNAQNNEFWFGPAGFFQGTTTTGGVKVNLGTGTSTSVDTLDPQTCYEFLVRTACGPGDTSLWVGPIQFCTQCAAISAPHLEDWDALISASKDLGCYSGIEGASLQSSNFLGVTIQSSTFYNPPTPPNYVELDNSSNVTDDLILVSPLTNDLDAGDKRVRFFARDLSTFNTAQLLVGTMSDPSNGNTFSALDTIDLGGAFVEYIVNLDAANGYNGTDMHFAFAHDLGGTFDALLIDEVRYERIPTCPRPSNNIVIPSSISDTSATFTWSAAGSGTSFEVEYGINPLGDPGNTRLLMSTDSLALFTLTPGTAYCYWVREICAPGDTSFWAGPTCFSTLCPLNGYLAPYFTNFEGISIGTASGSPAGWENCWTHTTISGSVRWESEDATGSNENSTGTGPFFDATFYPVSGGTYMYLETSSSGGPAELKSPLIDISALNNPALKYYYHMFGTTINYMLVFAEDANGTRTLVDSIAGQQQAQQMDPFALQEIPLTNLTGSTYYFVFQGHRGTSFTGDISIDDVSVEEGSTCPTPIALAATNVTATQVDLSWTAGTGTFEIEYGVGAFAQGTGSVITTTQNPYTLTGLSGSTAYTFYVREICAPGDTSDWSTPGSFITPCVTVMAPYFTDFENIPIGVGTGTPPSWNNCWEAFNTTFNWESEDATGANENSLGTGPFTDATLHPASGGTYMYIETSASGNGPSELLSPSIDISSLTTPELSFAYHMFGATINKLVIAAEDPNGNRTLLDSLVGAQQTAQADSFFIHNISLSNLSGTVYRFVFLGYRGSSFTGDISIDDVRVDNAGSTGTPCLAPTMLVATANIGCDSVEVDWMSNSGGSIIEYGPSGFAPGSGTFTGIVTAPYTITGLSPNTAYDIYVADTCTGDTSSYINVSATTANAPQPTAAFTTSSTINGNQFILYVDATGSANGSSFTWDFGNGVTGSGMMDTVVFLGNGTYTVLLTVTNACGTDTISQLVNVNIGLTDNPLSNSLNVYPNPASHKVQVSFREVGSGDVEIRLRDAQGREVIQINDRMESGKYTKDIDVSSLARGIYMVEVKSGGLTAHRRLSIR